MTLVDALVDLGDLAEAKRLLEDTLRVDRPYMERGCLYIYLGLVRAWGGEREEAEEAAATAHQRLDHTDLDPQFQVPLATLDAELALAAGDPDRALDIAERCCRDHGEDVWTYHAVADCLTWRPGQRARNSQPWLLAEIGRQSDRHPRLPRARRRGAGGPVRRRSSDRSRSRRPAGSSPTDLTPREQEVLRLVADGRSNRAIAAELVISPKTASVHVSHILDKLMVSSRGEAAAAWHRGLVTSDQQSGAHPSGWRLLSTRPGPRQVRPIHCATKTGPPLARPT